MERWHQKEPEVPEIELGDGLMLHFEGLLENDVH
jgi:hypothetical protein